MDESVTSRPEPRLSTGITGLDQVLSGGLLRRGVYMVQGEPGGGKTILANQICFHHAKRGERVLYVTLMAETHERLLQYIEQLGFFDVSLVPSHISYLSAFSTLQESGLKALAELLRREARARAASLLVVDGLVAAEERAESGNEFKKFIQELQIHANLIGHTVLLLTSAGGGSVRAEHTMVDGVLELSDQRFGRRAERELEVKKLRGSDYLRGAHSFQITAAGIIVYPRLEALLQDPSREDACSSERVSTGIPDLDAMLRGGLRSASSTVMFGATGTGKTSVCLHFLSQASAAEPALMFGFYETPDRLLMKARALGLDLESKVEEGSLAIKWYPATERLLDALGHELLEDIRARGVKRVALDGVDGFMKAAAHPARISHFLSALTNELRACGVTTLYTSELAHLFSTAVELPIQGVSSLVENILLLRFVECEGRMLRVFSIVKTRDSAYDQALRELVISERGVTLGARVESSFGAQHNARNERISPLLRKLLGKRGRPT